MDLLRSYGLIQFVKGSYRSTLRRLKICAAPDCDIAFYDISKNGSQAVARRRDLRQCPQRARLPAAQEVSG
jgi:predicted RNA-binding Zn ribbon-like protein